MNRKKLDSMDRFDSMWSDSAEQGFKNTLFALPNTTKPKKLY